jgi:hypothetical protein
MPLHEDDPAREGNLTDKEYEDATKALIEQEGDAGLHTVPDAVMAAAIKQAKVRHGQ